jgi:hypothetical protein
MNHSEKTDADLFRFSNYLVSQYFDWKYLVKFIPEMYHGHFILDIYVISVHDTFLESWNFFMSSIFYLSTRVHFYFFLKGTKVIVSWSISKNVIGHY